MQITLSNITKHYHNKTVLDIPKLDFNIPKIYGVLGPNGSGKTTLLKIIGGLVKPSTGEVKYDGEALDDQRRQLITYVSQTPYLFRTSVFYNIAYPLKIRGFDQKTIQDKVLKVSSDLGLESFQQKLATTLSAGESQKVALARAMVFEPKVLLLDEPTANIDRPTESFLEHYISNYQTEHQATIILVTHDFELATRLCAQLFYLENGFLVSDLN